MANPRFIGQFNKAALNQNRQIPALPEYIECRPLRLQRTGHKTPADKTSGALCYGRNAALCIGVTRANAYIGEPSSCLKSIKFTPPAASCHQKYAAAHQCERTRKD